MNSQPTIAPKQRHPSPNLGIVASVFTVIFLAGLYPVTALHDTHFPGPWVSGGEIVGFFQTRSASVLTCSVLHFAAAICLGIFTASVVSRLHFLGVRAAGAHIALFGGLATAFNMTAGALVLWVMAYPGIANDPAVLRALYYLQYAFGGPGFSVPLGLLFAGIAVPAAFMKLLPGWLVVFGLALAVIGELSWISLFVPKALFLIPLTRFPGFVWLIAAGFALPKAARARSLPPMPHAAA
jgi:hypothetical protein